MEKRVKDFEENILLLKKKNELLEALIKQRDVEKFELINYLEEKEKVIHSLKLNGNGVCENGCHSIYKSMDEVVKADFKHKNGALAVKEGAENLKKKIFKLKEDNAELLEKNEQLEEDTMDGMEMLYMVRDREKKLIKQLEEYKK